MAKKPVAPATQVEIAEICNLDVSSVNKILNRVAGPKFKPETVRKVFQAARRVGYDLNRASKGTMNSTLRELYGSSRAILSHIQAGSLPSAITIDLFRGSVERAGQILKT